MKNPVERLLYIALALIFIGVGITLFILASVIHGQAQELKKIEVVAKTQERTIQEIKQGVADVEANNQQNTEYLRCLLSIHASGVIPALTDCAPKPPLASNTSPNRVVSPAPATSPAAPKPATSSQPAPSSPPTAQPSSTPAEQILNFIKGLL